MNDAATVKESEVPPDFSHTTRSPKRRMLSTRLGDSRERFVVGCVLLGAVALEVLPLAVVLLVLSGTQGPRPALPLPIWWMGTIVLLAWSTVALLSIQPGKSVGRRVHAMAMQAPVLLSGVLSLFLSFVLAGGTGVWIGLLASYLWWRGLLLGRDRLTQSRLYRRFVAGFVALVLALAIVGTLNGPARASLEGILALLMPVQMFVGLGAVVLAHLSDTVREHRRRQQRAAAEQPPATFRLSWVRTALGISATVVLPALLLALAVSFDAVQTLGAALEWLVQALVRALFFVLGPLIALLSRSAQSDSRKKPIYMPPPSSWQGTLPHIVLDVGAWVVAVLALLALVMLVLVLRRLLHRFSGWAHSPEFDEERERLNTSEVLRRQLRSLVTRLRRRPAADTDTEDLAAGSVRYRYREMLRVAESAGCGRVGSETPDEYARRMPAAASASVASTIGEREADSVKGALATLTEAYDTARYRDLRARDQPPPQVVAAQQAILRWFAAHALYRRDVSTRRGRFHHR